MSYDSLAMEPPGALSQEGYDRGPDIVAFRSTAAHWARLAALAALYVLAGKLGLHFAFVHASATAVWPPTGIALAAFLLFGPRVWPAVAVGAFLVNVTTAGSVATSLGVAAGNTLEGLLSAWAQGLMSAWPRYPRAGRIRRQAWADVDRVVVRGSRSRQ